jgi:hypothetical protein
VNVKLKGIAQYQVRDNITKICLNVRLSVGGHGWRSIMDVQFFLILVKMCWVFIEIETDWEFPPLLFHSLARGGIFINTYYWEVNLFYAINYHVFYLWR